MYLLLTWSITAGPNEPAVVEAEMLERFKDIAPKCEVVPGHTLLMPSTGGDAEYERLLDELTHVSGANDHQLRFALVKSRERNFAGEGFDTDLARSIIA